MKVEFVAIPVIFGTIAFIMWLVVTALQRNYRMKVVTEFHTRLLDKLGSVKDFSEFIQTDAGRQFMDNLAADTPMFAPHGRILRATQLGVVLCALGGGLLLLAWHFQGGSEYDAYFAFGVIAVSLGLGFAASSAISYRLTAAMGLLNGKNAGTSRR